MFTLRVCSALLFSVCMCGSMSGCASSGAPTVASAPSRGSDIITAAELSDPSLTGDALDAVRRLRPRFLVKRGAQSIRAPEAGDVHVSVDGGPLQALSMLSRFRPIEIAEIRYLNSSDAAQRFGTTAGSGGVILVKSK